MLAAIHVDDAMRARVAQLVQDVNLSAAFRRQAENQLPRVRVDAWHAHGQARDVRFVLLLACVPELLRPREERQLARLQPAFAFDVSVRPTTEPRSAQIGMTIRQPWHRTIDVLVGDERRAARRNARDALLRLRLPRQQQRESRCGCRDHKNSVHHRSPPLVNSGFQSRLTSFSLASSCLYFCSGFSLYPPAMPAWLFSVQMSSMSSTS